MGRIAFRCERTDQGIDRLDHAHSHLTENRNRFMISRLAGVGLGSATGTERREGEMPCMEDMSGSQGELENLAAVKLPLSEQWVRKQQFLGTIPSGSALFS